MWWEMKPLLYFDKDVEMLTPIDRGLLPDWVRLTFFVQIIKEMLTPIDRGLLLAH